MSEMFKNIIETEKQEILEWIEEVEEGGVITLTSFKWKTYIIEWHGDFRIKVKDDMNKDSEEIMFESYEEALDKVEEMIYENYGVER